MSIMNFSRVNKNAARLRRMLESNGQWLITVHNGLVVKLQKVDKPIDVQEAPSKVEKSASANKSASTSAGTSRSRKRRTKQNSNRGSTDKT